MAYVLGIDVGSSSTKAGLFRLQGATIAQAAHSSTTDEPLPGYKEQDPESWWRAAKCGIAEITKSVPSAEIVALGITGHISSLTFVNLLGKPLRPALSFQDQRAVEELDELNARYTRLKLAKHLGIDLPPAVTWPLPRLMWLKKHEPSTLDRAHCLLQAKDFVNFRLTGEFAGDHSSFRGLVDFKNGRPATDLLSSLGLPENLLPRLCRPDEVIGTVTRAAAEETGLPAGLPIVAGWNDLNACALGSGATAHGNAFNVTGTSEHLGVVTSSQYQIPELICAPFLPTKQLFYGVTTSGGGSLAWMEKMFSQEAQDLLAQAASVPVGAGSLLFLPYLEGERSPIWDPEASGAFIGLRTSHVQAHLARAVLEGVAFSLRQTLDLLGEHAPEVREPFIVSGGAARASLWNQIKADVLGRSIAVPKNPQTGILGAAILAAVGTGYYRDCEEAAHAMIQPGEEFLPCPDNTTLYSELYAIYCQLYPALQKPFTRIHAQRRKASHV